MFFRSKPFHQQNTCTTNDSRRRFMQFGLCAASSFLLPEAMAAPTTRSVVPAERNLSLLNLHTGEKLDTTYWIDGMYIGDELTAISKVLRDHRSGEEHPIDLKLLDLLSNIHQTLDGKQSFQIISGYRSPKTNAKLRQKSNGVAKKSLHMQGKAIDVRLPGRPLADLRKVALSYKAGGVGYYPSSDFLHVDTGRVRRWG
jgi:uncharacterized protein YcbK (DUF882 family)